MIDYTGFNHDAIQGSAGNKSDKLDELGWLQAFQAWCPIKILDANKAPKAKHVRDCYKTGFEAGWGAQQERVWSVWRESNGKVQEETRLLVEINKAVRLALQAGLLGLGRRLGCLVWEGADDHRAAGEGGEMSRSANHHAERCRELYDALFPALKERARIDGYALLSHGSLAYDIDLVACPWREGCTTAAQLAEDIRIVCEAVTETCFVVHGEALPVEKPHGRLAWTFHFGGGPYIDLSVMPTIEKGNTQ